MIKNEHYALMKSIIYKPNGMASPNDAVCSDTTEILLGHFAGDWLARQTDNIFSKLIAHRAIIFQCGLYVSLLVGFRNTHMNFVLTHSRNAQYFGLSTSLYKNLFCSDLKTKRKIGYFSRFEMKNRLMFRKSNVSRIYIACCCEMCDKCTAN